MAAFLSLFCSVAQGQKAISASYCLTIAARLGTLPPAQSDIWAHKRGYLGSWVISQGAIFLLSLRIFLILRKQNLIKNDFIRGDENGLR